MHGPGFASEAASRGIANSSILVVDDDPTIVESLVELLNRSGYRAHGACSFAQGRKAMEESPINLLITDVRLGASNGLQLVLHAQMSVPPMPVIVMTGFADSVLENEARRMGAIFLPKPIPADELLATVRKQLKIS